MGDVTGKIGLYHVLFQVCLGLAILCLILALVLFFLLDIPDVIGYLTGRQKRKVVQAMEAQNAKSGRLMQDRARQHSVQQMQEELGISQNANPGARKVEHVVEQDTQPDGKQDDETPQETSLLKEEVPTDPDGATDMLEEATVRQGRFFIEREVVFIHAEEII